MTGVVESKNSEFEWSKRHFVVLLSKARIETRLERLSSSKDLKNRVGLG